MDFALNTLDISKIDYLKIRQDIFNIWVVQYNVGCDNEIRNMYMSLRVSL